MKRKCHRARDVGLSDCPIERGIRQEAGARKICRRRQQTSHGNRADDREYGKVPSRHRHAPVNQRYEPGQKRCFRRLSVRKKYRFKNVSGSWISRNSEKIRRIPHEVVRTPKKRRFSGDLKFRGSFEIRVRIEKRRFFTEQDPLLFG